MKAPAFRIPLLIAALSIVAAISLQAAPSLPITKVPVMPNNLTGPMPDPMSTNGQWFIRAGVEEYRTHEFHDNLLEYGGGNTETYAIQGIVPPGGIQYSTGANGTYGDPIVGFTIEATIFNDTQTTFGDASSSDNSHGESRPDMPESEFYVGTLVKTKLTAEFAIADLNTLPKSFDAPYRELVPYIIAENEDQLAWYCWNPQDPPAGSESGNYYVPTWDFGDIPVGQSATKTLNFTVNPPMDSTDPRYSLLYASRSDGIDLFANRTTSLKISTWIDNLCDDSMYTPYPEEALRSSDVSVFHDEEPPYEPTHKMHWPQLPDPNGWDVRACLWSEQADGDGMQKVLADDFRCSSNGPITKITFWGSFKYDEYNYEDELYQGITNIHLSLHKDIPAEILAPWSMPEIPALWETNINPHLPPQGWEVTVTPETPSWQGWYDPNHEDDFEEENHQNYFRYEVTIPPDDAFVQTSGEIYWLDLSVLTDTPNSMWGWKTSVSEHFNDDAVWTDRPVTNALQWKELRDPITGESLDLAFVIDSPPEEPPEDPHKMHWPQYPDPHGWDVRACNQPDGIQKVLADDFLCTSNGPITHITFWGSFRWDENIPSETFHGINMFHLSLHNDIPDPDGEGPLYSMPKLPPRWVWNIDPYAPPQGWTVTVQPEEPSEQGWYDPNLPDNTEHPNHYQYFRYDITLPASNAFVQTEGTIYWLDVSAKTSGPEWGWKTSGSQHFNDDGVWADLPVLNTNQWGELRDPFTGESLDLAFIIDGEEPEPQEQLDWGDAPDAAGTVGFNTLAGNSGANHLIVPSFMLGTLIDNEPNGQPTGFADGDDINGAVPYPPGDEEGVLFTSAIIPGLTATLQVTLTGPASGGLLDAWMDLDGSGTWTAGDQIFTSHALTPGTNSLNFPVPNTAVTGTSYARFRLSTVGGLPPTGYASDGEVEDYMVVIEDPIDWGDAPDPAYPTLSASMGASHYILGGRLNPTLGVLVDPEPDGQPTVAADGDDLDVLYPSLGDDEDGITFNTPLVPNTVAQITVIASGPAGYLQCWVDANGNGFWGDPGEQVLTDVPLTPGNNSLTFVVPSNGTGGFVYAGIRFRYSSARGLTFTGPAQDGEVEDYMEDVSPEVDVDWGDAPTGYPTLAANNGAHHVILSGMFLGNQVDSEPAGQPSINADGDDNDLLYPSLGDDEDGVFLTSLLMPGGFASVDVIASQPGVLDAWVDFNADGSWAQTGDQIFTGQPLSAGVNSLLFPVPLTAAWGPGYSRFRFTSGGAPSYTGLAVDGEVEDYEFLISRLASGIDFGDAPNTYPTLLPTGARHTITTGVMLGATIDPEPDGQPSPASLDDIVGLDDEDGVIFTSKVVAGSNATVNVVAGVSGGMLDAWIDFNADGTWSAGEHLFGASLPLAPGLNAGLTTLKIPSPPALKLGPTFARFRISSGGGLAPGGAANDGEVEDYMVDLYQPAPTNLVITNLTFDVSNTVSTVEWTAQSSSIYQMESSTNLITGPWAPAGSTVLGPANLQTNNISAETNKFYRVTAPWTP